MSLAPLLDASPVIQIHAFAAFAAFGLGLVQFAAPKGTLPHRTVRLAVGGAARDHRDQLVLDSRDQDVGAVQPDPSSVDLRAVHVAARGVGGASA